ncbi:restriction endonuclease subunit S [Noviherbaspirillum cavernae]|uniref:Restriction endonuclease subunit S n=1 Tax=Noviherbaspirillum cavernae TaxID=2320862 RepID=A0A418X0X4_9BURK|nr:restriction endonuclease subunit S [Noviherbaspirillum cavernae]RJG05993.1 restriction endonuclease subunit S [Noviherbaspirillum cavernae]
MSSDPTWEKMTLNEAGVTLIDCDHRTPPATEVGYPYIAIPQLKDGHISLEGVRRISQEHYQEWTRKLKPQANDVIVVRRCNSGLSAVVPPNFDCAIGQNLIILRSDSKKVAPEFLRWLVRGPEWWEQVGKFINVGAVFDSLRCRDIPNFELSIPPIESQREISLLLGALDDRIALLRDTNATLEAIVQTLFKSWFVDFDPVRAKQEGRAPEGMDEETAALFPDEFELSTRGSIPRGWRVGPILDGARLLSGGTPKTDRSEYWEGEIPWASAKDVSQSADSILIETERTITKRGLEESSTKMIPAFASVVVARGATTGRMVLFGESMAMNQTCYALDSKTGTPIALYCQLRREVIGLVNAAHGSVFDTITTSTFAQSAVVHPPESPLKAFEEVTAPLYQKILAGTKTLRFLSSLRDTLLPRLISGQLRLPDAEALIDEAA